MKTIPEVEYRENRKKRNKSVVEAMTDEELQEIKELIITEQGIRTKKAIKKLGT